jgi:hypothetical protein
MRKSLFVVLGLVVIASSVTARQLQTPTDWKWRTDTPAKLATAGTGVPADGLYFVTMAPGWHITMGPGGLLYPTGRTASGNFTLEAQIFLFPGDSQEEYGIFIGGKSIDGSAAPEYTAFVARKDGQAGLVRAGASREVVGGWKSNDAVLPHPGGDSTAKNILRVEVGAAEVIYSANGKEVGRWPRASLQTDGAFGFRVGKGLNLHISTFDVTQRLAPVPIKK